MFHLYVKSKEHNKWTNKNGNRLIDTENRLIVARGEEFGRVGEKGEGIKKYKLVVTEQSWGCSTGNIVNNILITVMVSDEY